LTDDQRWEASVFTPEQRDQAREWIERMAQADPRVTAGALIGSLAAGAEDAWSDIDLTYAIRDDVAAADILQDWTEAISREFGVLDWWDLPAATSVYRVYLLPNGLEVDLSVTPQRAFSLRGERVQVLFGEPQRAPDAPGPDARQLIGLGWHHVIHARSSIARAKPWRAEYWISALRDHTLALACLRLGENAVYARGVDQLPATITDPLKDGLVRSLDATELRRALAVVTGAYLDEVSLVDAALGARLGILLRTPSDM
jgi:predicted nucleotidyltransferase